MFGKLLKYEIKSVGRVMLPLYLVILAVSAFIGIMIRAQISLGTTTLLAQFSALGMILLVITCIASAVIMAILIIQRFYVNLLGQEGYLMFTLPASTLSQIASKALTALLWTALGGAAGLAAGFIIFSFLADVPALIDTIVELWNELLQASGWNPVTLAIMLILAAVCGFLGTLFKVYAAIAIGHQWNGHRIIGAIVGYLGIGIVESILLTIPGLNDAVKNVEMGDYKFLVIMIIIGILQTLVYGFVTWFLLDKHLNLE